MRIATIVARSELAQARTLAESLRAHAGEAEFVACVLDSRERDEFGSEPFEVLRAEDLAPRELGQLAARLPLAELREALKPQLLRRLHERAPGEALLYLDADSYACGSLAALEQLLEGHQLLLWPRAAGALPADGRRPNEADLQGWGLYDSGAIGLGAGHDHSTLLDWWVGRALVGPDPAAGARPLDRLRTIATSQLEVRDVGLGASFWNLAGHSIAQRGEQLLLDGAPASLLRLVGFDSQRPEQLSDKQDRIRVGDHPPLDRLLLTYAARLQANGESQLRGVPYAWDTLPDGTRLDQRLRDIYAIALVEGDLRSAIFTRSGMDEFYTWLAAPAPEGAAFGINRLCWLVREAQPELREAYPDLDRAKDASGLIGWLHTYGLTPGTLPAELVPPLNDRQELERRQLAAAPPWGVNVAGYFRSELGVGQAARSVVAALDAADVPLLPVHGSSAPASRQDHEYATLDSAAAHFPANIVCVNADGLPAFREEVGESFFASRHTIGMWWWEAAAFPEHLHGSFSLLDEIWVGSEFVADALRVDSSVPVYPVTLPVTRPRVQPAPRERLGVGPGFMFLFMFDYHSVFERKNPLAVIEAFKRAFTTEGEARLLIKSTNGSDDPRNSERLQQAAAGREDVHLLEGYLEPHENDALIATCDSYVSLHRSEGFGLTPAEAMALGKPVIATGYSGNLDYMTARNALLVDYELTPIGPGNAPYPAEGEWAQPSVEHAATLMRMLVADPAAAHALGERASADIGRTRSLQSAGRSMKMRLDALRLQHPHRVAPLQTAPVQEWPTVIDYSPGLRPRLVRFLARAQLGRLERRIAALQDLLGETQRELVELRNARAVDVGQTQREIALLQAEVLASLRRRRLN